MVFIIVSGILALALVVQTVIHHIERKDLYNRIMSQDLGEYMARTEQKPGRKDSNYLKKKVSKAYRSMYGYDETD